MTMGSLKNKMKQAMQPNIGMPMSAMRGQGAPSMAQGMPQGNPGVGGGPMMGPGPTMQLPPQPPPQMMGPPEGRMESMPRMNPGVKGRMVTALRKMVPPQAVV